MLEKSAAVGATILIILTAAILAFKHHWRFEELRLNDTSDTRRIYAETLWWEGWRWGWIDKDAGEIVFVRPRDSECR